LLEYGAAGLAVASTDVGQCRRVLDEGRLGRLVPSKSPELLGKAIAELLADNNTRRRFADDFRQSVAQTYSVESVVKQLANIYSTLLVRS
ncbi:MAG: glycosyltransferase, partial [Pirellulaceae bacterium]|nr:glycosyltransferase [Pirellulaceae bacterium]